jgi:hypothetical protein
LAAALAADFSAFFAANWRARKDEDTFAIRYAEAIDEFPVAAATAAE